MSIKILVADDHKIIREGLRSLLEKEPDMEMVAATKDGRTAVRLALELQPDLIIMDIGMPDLNGIEAARQTVSQLPHIKIIALSAHSDKRFVERMLAAGASGYLLKECAFKELIHAIRVVMNGETYLSPKITSVVVKDYVSQGTNGIPVLSAREREVLQLIAEGKTTKEIGSCLNVSVKTVETHRSQIMRKLNLRSIADLTKYAVREGLTSLD